MNDELMRSAKAVLDSNWTGQFTRPSPGLYSHQWNWDAGFIAIGYAHFNMDRAEAELRSLFRGQWHNGLLPQIVFGEEQGAKYFPGPDFWQGRRSSFAPEYPLTTGITMPPVHGFCLWRIYEIARDKARATDFLQEMYPKVLALHRYLYEFRDPEEEGLVHIRHPWEGGTDNSPTWDSTLATIDPTKLKIPAYARKDLRNQKTARHRPASIDYDRCIHLVDLFRSNDYDEEAILEMCPFMIQDPLFNSILAWSNECLIKIGNLLGEDVLELILWNEMTVYSMNEKLWDEVRGIYNAYDLRRQRFIPVHTSSGLMPLIGEIPTQEQAEKLLLTLKSGMFTGRYGATYLCPTYNLERADVNCREYWHGPVWINMNWMLYHGLLRYDFKDTALQLKSDTLELLSRYGFFEYFDPRKNQAPNLGCGVDRFSWSAALCVDLLSES